MVLQKAVEQGNDAGSHKINPNPRTGFLIGIRGQEGFRGGIGVFKELADHGAFVEGFVFVFEGGNETTRVQGQEGSGFVVGVYFNVLEGDLLFEEDKPGIEELALPSWEQQAGQAWSCDIERYPSRSNLSPDKGRGYGWGGGHCLWGNKQDGGST